MAGDVTAKRGFSVGSDTNWVFWDVDFRDIRKDDSYEVWRRAGSGAFTLIHTSAPVPDIRGVNLYVDYAKRYFEDTSVSNGVTYTYRIRVKTLLGELGAFSSDLSVVCQGNKYYVSSTGTDAPTSGSSTTPYETMEYALTQVTANVGNVIYYKTGDYTEASGFTMPDGVSIRGQSGVTVTFTEAYDNTWWDNPKALFKYNSSSSGTPVDAEVSNISFTTGTGSASAWGAVYFRNRLGWVVKDLVGRNFFRSTIYTQSNTEDFLIRNCDLRETGQESGSFSAGNVTTKANVRNGTIHGMIIKGLVRGYGIKMQYAYETPSNDVENVHVFDCDYDMKDFSEFSSEYNISHENYTVRNKWFIWSNNRTNMQVSTDKNNETLTSDGNLAYYFHHNTYVVKKAALKECASSYTLDEDNVYDNRNNSNPWGGIGEFNTGVALTNKTYRRNVFLNAPGALYVFTCRVQNLVTENCTIQSPGSVTLCQWRNANSDGVKDGFVFRNNVVDCVGGLNMHSAIEGANVANVPTYSDTTGNVIRGSVTLSGVTALDSSTLVATPQLQRTGLVPDPYYRETVGGNAEGKGAFATESEPPENQFPVVAISSPATGTSITLGDSVTVSYTASDADGTVVLRELMVDGQVVDSASSGSSFSYTPGSVGVKTITVRVTDNSGAVNTSTGVLLTVLAVPVVLPPAAIVASAPKTRLKLYRTRKRNRLVLLTK